MPGEGMEAPFPSHISYPVHSYHLDVQLYVIFFYNKLVKVSKCFSEFCDHSSKLFELEEGVIRTPNCSLLVTSNSLLVRSSGDILSFLTGF